MEFKSSFVTEFHLRFVFQTACFFALCERQLLVYKQRFLASVLHQDLAWFDANPVGKLTAKMTK